MSPVQLRRGREAAGLTQQQAVAKLGISQAYLALLENGRRRLPEHLAVKLVDLYHLPATALPLEDVAANAVGNSETVASQVAGLGYPGFAYLRPAKRRNPASVLLMALSAADLERRVVEALPWLVLEYPHMDWDWLLPEVKQRELQNRLGFVVNLARRLAERNPRDPPRLERLAAVEASLERARLVREDTLCQQALSEAERRWLRDVRPPESRHWNLLADLTLEHLPYAA